MDKKLGRKVDV